MIHPSQFLSRASELDLKTFTGTRVGLLISMRHLDAELQEFRDFLNRNDADIPPLFFHKIVDQPTFGPYKETTDREVAVEVAKEFKPQRAKRSNRYRDLPGTGMGTTAHSKFPARSAHDIAVRLKDSESKFSGDLEEHWQGYVDGYNQLSRDYDRTTDQKRQSKQCAI